MSSELRNFLWPDASGDLWTAIGAILTFAAIFVALFLAFWPEWRERWRRPVLSLDIHFSPPDCGFYKQAEIRRVAVVGEGIVGMQGVVLQSDAVVDAYWFRMLVRNTGATAARNVEVTVSDMSRLLEGNRRPHVPERQTHDYVRHGTTTLYRSLPSLS